MNTENLLQVIVAEEIAGLGECLEDVEQWTPPLNAKLSGLAMTQKRPLSCLKHLGLKYSTLPKQCRVAAGASVSARSEAAR